MRLVHLTILVSFVIILVTEFLMWECFRRRFQGVRMAQHTENSFFQFFTMGRVGVVALLHTVFLGAVTAITFLSLW